MDQFAHNHYPEMQDAERLRREEYKRYVVGAVDPKGRVREIVCAPTAQDPTQSPTAGYTPVVLSHGEPALTVYGKSQGWTLLRDRCEKDGCPERYDAWLEAVRARVDGHHIDVPDLAMIYPPSVLEQRAAIDSDITSKVFVVGKGFVDVGGLTPDERKDRLARLAQQLGMEVPGEADAEPKKGRK